MGLIKRQVILERHPVQQSANYVYFEADAEIPDVRTDGYYMTLDHFLDMNSPEVITVTVVPGDALNVDGNAGITSIEQVD